MNVTNLLGASLNQGGIAKGYKAPMANAPVFEI
jgi:hypothetical protein